MKETLPSLTTDEAADRFVDDAYLSAFDLSVFKPHTFEFCVQVELGNQALPLGGQGKIAARTTGYTVGFDRPNG